MGFFKSLSRIVKSVAKPISHLGTKVGKFIRRNKNTLTLATGILLKDPLLATTGLSRKVGMQGMSMDTTGYISAGSIPTSVASIPAPTPRYPVAPANIPATPFVDSGYTASTPIVETNSKSNTDMTMMFLLGGLALIVLTRGKK